ncbi:hypothetical protein N8083_01970 [Candidatus Pacebacteria bacterium]|nr:hypothetical protein [Candidatus Paceibacterota bacterium]
MIHVLNNKIIYFILSNILLFCLPFFAFAADTGFISLVGVPGIENIGKPGGLQGYINTLMRVAVIAAALIALIKLILAGAQYILSGIVTDKENAKKDIKAALTGLLIVIAAVAILRTINPDLLNLPTLAKFEGMDAPFGPPANTPMCKVGEIYSPDAKGNVVCKTRTGASFGDNPTEIDKTSSVYKLEKKYHNFELTKKYGVYDGNYAGQNATAPTQTQRDAWKADCESTAGNEYKEISAISTGIGYYCGKKI